jgi:hypothetical protein
MKKPLRLTTDDAECLRTFNLVYEMIDQLRARAEAAEARLAAQAAQVMAVVNALPEESFAGNTYSRVAVSKYELRKRVQDALFTEAP